MGWSESGRGCKHQYLVGHVLKQSSPGVCSSCLSERLSQLYAPSSTYFSDRVIPTALSSRSDRSSVSSSASESPLPLPRGNNTKGGGGGGRHHRTASEMLGSMSFMVRSSTGRGGGGGGGGDRGVMKKSRSMAVVSKISHFGDHLVKRKSGGGGKKKKGFWSKLLRTTGNSRNKEVLKHSKSSIR